MHAELKQVHVGLAMCIHVLYLTLKWVLHHFTDEEEVVPQKLKKAVKQSESKTSKEVVHVKER